MQHTNAMTAPNLLSHELLQLARRADDLRELLNIALTGLANAAPGQHPPTCAECVTATLHVQKQSTTLAALTARLYDRLPRHCTPTKPVER